MESGKGDVPSPAILGEELCLAALMTDPCGQPPISLLAPLTSSHGSKPSEESLQKAVCGAGGNLPYPETIGPRGQSAPPCDVEGYPRDKPLPDKSPLTLSHGRTGTNNGPITDC